MNKSKNYVEVKEIFTANEEAGHSKYTNSYMIYQIGFLEGAGTIKLPNQVDSTCGCPQGSLCEFFEKKDESCKYGKI